MPCPKREAASPQVYDQSEKELKAKKVEATRIEQEAVK